MPEKTVTTVDRKNFYRNLSREQLIRLLEKSYGNAELVADEPRLEDLVNSVECIVWEADIATQRLTFISNQAERILGYPPQEWISNPNFWIERLDSQDRERVLTTLSECVASNQGCEIEYRTIASDGRVIWLRDTISVTSEGGKAIKLSGTSEDITQQKAAEAAVKEAEERLRQSQKMEAVGRLAGGLAHDFNNLLTAIIGYADLVLSDNTASEKIHSNVEQIATAGKRAADLTRQLLAFSRRQVLRPKVLDLTELLRNELVLLKRVVGSDVELVTNIPSTPLLIKADPSQIEQVMMNLIINGSDSMPEGGTLTLESFLISFDELAVQRAIVDLPPGAYACVMVHDNGGGMDEETISQIFEPFFTAKNHGCAAGMGLSTVYGIVKQSGGDITVNSIDGKGSVFSVYLPIVEESVPQISRRESTQSVQCETETILLVEDEPAVRALIRSVLESAGYHVLEADSGLKAVEVSMNYPKHIHLLLTDVVMPHMNGREAAEQILQQRPGLKVLYVSGYTSDEIIRNGLLQSEAVLLHKPFAPSILVKQLQDMLHPDDPVM